MMFDAEAAVMLLNRWKDRPATDERGMYLELLREGNLNFIHQRCRVPLDGIEGAWWCRTETLAFADGSRAVRISASSRTPAWTRWTAFEPQQEYERENPAAANEVGRSGI